VVVENLKSMLKSFNTSDPIYLGCKFRTVVKQGYMSGGGGYVLSREALERFAKVLSNLDLKKIVFFEELVSFYWEEIRF
jgi:hypothetical protein